ncbi:hypothetical protein [Larkinella soli]|uniref:hypothetical protein n=1 Tax=Larkinella soli TaxID=1770527 RepID=UPI000FFB19E7|nr:hypothetical protein [Larkinella soli]
MAATDDEWERLLRRRLEEYESEPESDPLSHILARANPAPSPGRRVPLSRRSRLLGWSAAALAVLTSLILGVGNYLSTDKAGEPGSSVAVRRLKPVVPQPENFGTGLPSARPAAAASNFLTDASGRAPAAGPNDAREPSYSQPSGNRLQPQTERIEDRLAPAADHASVGFAGRTPVTPWVGENRVERDRLSSTADDPAPAGSASPAENRFILAADRIAFRPLHYPALTTALPEPAYRAPAIEPERTSRKPSLFAGVMPLYTFRKVTPVRQDEVVMEKIQPATSLSSRAGWRLQLGAEWPLSRRFGLRIAGVYQQLQQQMAYTARSARPDSSRMEWIDAQTIRVVPLYKSQEKQVKTTWRYVALSAEGRLKLNGGGTAPMGLQHSLAAGLSVGYLLTDRHRQPWQPSVQASYGIERRLTDHLRLQVEPGIVYNLSAISDNSRCFNVRPYSYGMIVGLRWKP